MPGYGVKNSSRAGKGLKEGTVKILLAVDGSTHSDAAIDEIARLPWPVGTEIKVISVIEMPILSPAEFPAWPDYLDEIERVLRKRAQAAIEAALSKLRAGECKTLKLMSEIFQGSAKEAIVNEAERWRADLIVVGSRGLGALDRFLLGSVSHAVVQHAKCSVEVVRRPS